MKLRRGKSSSEIELSAAMSTEAASDHVDWRPAATGLDIGAIQSGCASSDAGVCEST